MDLERILISRLVQSGEVDLAVSRGIGPKHFNDDANRAVFSTIVKHMGKYNVAPSRAAVLTQHPQYRLDIVEDSTEYIIDEFIKQVKKNETKKALIDVAHDVEDPSQQMDLETALFKAAERVAQIVPSSRASRLSDAPKRIDLYNKLLRTGKIPGVPLGYPTLNNAILGIQPYEVVTIAAFSGIGKSTVLQHMALTAYVTDPDQRPLFISLEMDAEALLRRFDAMGARIRANAIKALDLGEGDLRKYEQWAQRTQKAPNDIHIIDDVHSCTVERVMAETMRYKPTATFTDYVQLMDGDGDNSYKRVGDAVKGLKRVARMSMIPQFTAAQTTRSGATEGVTINNVADSIEIYRSSDIMLGIERDEEYRAKNTALLKIVKNRDGFDRGEVEINFDWDHMDFGEREKFGKREPPPIQPNNPFMS